MKSIVNFIKSLLGFESSDESMIGLSSFKAAKSYGSPKKVSQSKAEPTLSTLLTRKQFQ